MDEVRLCRLSELADPGSRGFELPGLDCCGPLSILLVRNQGEVFAYRNQCPHLGVNMEWQPDRFLDIENRFIQCGMHGALFRIEDGYCVRGPCVGKSLDPLPLRVEADWVYVAR